jgi:hypothetical protein
MQEIRISDLQLAAYLVAHGQQIVRVERPLGRREFVFADLPAEVILSCYAGSDHAARGALPRTGI